jgi:arginine-tRNA-protein transferase
MSERGRKMKVTDFSDIVIVDETEPCPYLDGQTARMPLRMPLTKITPAQADVRLAEGHRRTGEFIYQTKCPSCSACQPIRIDCDAYEFSKNEKRVLARGNRKYRQTIGDMQADKERVALFNLHRRQRGLAKRDTDIDLEEYVWGFVRSCLDSFEIAYFNDDGIACVGICDIGRTSLSAVYTFYDPNLKADSMGTYSILKQIEWCKMRKLKHLYLGFYVEESRHMLYKSRFAPNERLIDGQWVRFERYAD